MSSSTVVLIFSVLFAIKMSYAEPMIPNKLLKDGNFMPTIALGTFLAGSEADLAKLRQAVKWAIESGYRHIDTAAHYNDETEIGQGVNDAVEEGLVKREDLFVTTKVWNDNHRRHQVIPALQASLKRLNMSYVDLYLIHFPIAEKADGSPDDTDYLETWAGMEDAQKQGLTKSIGVSNFNSEQIERIIANSNTMPAVNQIEVNPTLSQEPLVAYCQSKNITVMAYSPFGVMVPRRNKKLPPAPPRLDDPTLLNIGKKYGKSSTQVVLRYLLDRGLVPIPKSTNIDHQKQNIDVFDFNLTNEEIAEITKFNQNIRVIDKPLLKNHPYYPHNKDLK